MECKVYLELAGQEDAELFHRLQTEAFLPLYEKYRDDDTSLAKETLEETAWKLGEKGAESYLIYLENQGMEAIGGIRVRHESEDFCQVVNRVAPVFVIPSFQNQGIGFLVLQKIFSMYSDTDVWKLHTILQEKRNCHLYEKCGFRKTGRTYRVNERMTVAEFELALRNGKSLEQIP